MSAVPNIIVRSPERSRADLAGNAFESVRLVAGSLLVKRYGLDASFDKASVRKVKQAMLRAGIEVAETLRARAVDDDGALRVITHPVTFASLMDRSFGALAQYCATDMVACLRYLNALGEVSTDCDDADRLATIRSYADRLEELASQGLKGFNLTRVRTRAAELRTALDQPDYKASLRDGTAWLAGTA